MNDADAERLRTRIRRNWKPDMLCASCAKMPTCPQLHDALWARAWDALHDQHRRGTMPMRALVCSLPLRCGELMTKPEGSPETHAPNCEMSRGAVRPMLCFECAERALGRQLTLEDLSPCLANYAQYIMQQRASSAR